MNEQEGRDPVRLKIGGEGAAIRLEGGEIAQARSVNFPSWTKRQPSAWLMVVSVAP
jgi:hypothetical protein